MLGVLVVVALVASSAASVASYLAYKLDQFDYIDVELSAAPPAGAPRNLLIVGSDSRDGVEAAVEETGAFLGGDAAGSGQRADTIMVVRVEPDAGSVEVLSIPRDLWVPISGTGRSQRINTAYGQGPQRLVDTIEESLDIPIHHYVEVDFVGFIELVGAVGGVPMWFETPVRDQQAGLDIPNPGCHRLDAESALAYTRSRAFQYQDDEGRWHTDPTGDLGRISRQQVFLRRSVDQVSQLGITDALTLNRLLDVGIASVTLDRGLGLNRLRDLAAHFSDFDSDTMRTHALPTYSFRTSGGALVERLEAAEAQPMLNPFRGLPADALAPVQVQDITVLNATGTEGQAALVADALEQVGFGVDAVGNVESGTQTRTVIRHALDAERAADLLERHLTDGAVLEADATLDDGAIVLEVGSDFTTIGRNARPLAVAEPTDRPPSPTSPASNGGPGAPSTDPGGAPDEPVEPNSIGVAPDPSVRCV